MRKNALVICCISCVFGAFGAFFRWLQNMTAFDAATGLYISGNLWGKLLVILSIALAVVLAVVVMGLKSHRLGCSDDYTVSLKGETMFFRPLFLAISCVMLVGSAIVLLNASGEKHPNFSVILSVLGILAAIGFALVARATMKRRNPPLNCLGATLIIALYCFWLIVSYRENANTAVIWRYAVEVLALSCALVGFYYIAGLVFGRPKPYRAIFFSQLGAYLCIVSFPDERALGYTVMLAGTVGMLLFLSWMIVANLKTPEQLDAMKPAKKEPAPAPIPEFEPDADGKGDI